MAPLGTTFHSLVLFLGIAATFASAAVTDTHHRHRQSFRSGHHGHSMKTPDTVVLDPQRLVDAKHALDHGKGLKAALSSLITQADEWLPQGPWSVTSKTIIPPGGTIHDYASQAPYYWANETSPDGCPYINRDGEVNPESKLYTDHDDRARMFIASYVLSLAWWYTGKEAYGRRAGDVLRTWFIAEDTRMNPNLNHAQIVPCANTGRAIGIIDWSQGYTSVLDAAAILAAGAPGWSAADDAAFKAWNVEYLNWLETSDFGITETAATNNHGTFAILQSAGVALYTGNAALAASKATAMQERIDKYIATNGSQPQELARTRSFHYSVFDLVAYTRMADIAKKPAVCVDLWGYVGEAGQSIMQAVNFILAAATEAEPWAFPELEFNASIASDVVHSAADNGNANATAAVNLVPPPDTGDLWLVGRRQNN